MGVEGFLGVVSLITCTARKTFGLATASLPFPSPKFENMTEPGMLKSGVNEPLCNHL